MGLSLDELAERYVAGTLTDEELEASGYEIHQVKNWVKTPTYVKIQAALEKGMPDIMHESHYGGQKIQIRLNEDRGGYDLNVWGDRMIIDTTEGGWQRDLDDLCYSITDKIMEETGIAVFIESSEREFLDRGIITVRWEE